MQAAFLKDPESALRNPEFNSLPSASPIRGI